MRKRLGLPPKEHTERANEMLTRGERRAGDAKAAVMYGRCGQALDALTEGFTLLGTAEAHTSAAIYPAGRSPGGEPYTGVDRRRLQRLDEALENAREDFLDTCMRARSEADAPLRMASFAAHRRGGRPRKF